jgi:bifunctional non-homologous end joining protein LigD
MRHENRHREHRGRAAFDIAVLANARVGELPDEVDPELPTRAEAPPTGDAWLHETKFDGYRLFARLEGRDVRLFGGDHRDWRLPALEKALGRLAADSALLDGQLVALQADGTSSFRHLEEAVARGRTAQLVYESFDLLYLDGYDLTQVELAMRKRALKTLLTGGGVIPNRGAIRYVHHFDGNGAELFDEICRLGLVGIVCKLRTSRYRSGPSSDWLEVQCARAVSVAGASSCDRVFDAPRDGAQSTRTPGMRFALSEGEQFTIGRRVRDG